MTRFLPFAFAAALCSASVAHADLAVFGDKASFLGATGATQATQPYPANPWPEPAVGAISSGSVTLTASPGIYVGDYSVRLPYDVISINDREHLDVAFNAPVYAMGFDFVEPEFDPWVNASFVDSTFTVTLSQGASVVGSFQFNAPNDTAAFVGVWSTAAFDRASIRETTGDIENEMYGQFYSGATAMPVPEPQGLVLTLAGMGVVAWWSRRRRG
jgi:hypothetical protein